MARLTGAMPKGTAGAEATLRKQTSQHMPIVTCQDLSKGKGDEVTFHLLNPVNAKPIMGSRNAEGRGTGSFLSAKISCASIKRGSRWIWATP